MQIVIDISKDIYNDIVNYNLSLTKADELCRAVVNGTPLPKGHGRLIEVTNRLEQELFTFQRYTGIDEAPYESAIIIIDDAPTIIEADGGGDDDESM